MGFYLLIFLVMGVGMLVQWRLKSKMNAYGQIPLPGGITGRDVAAMMLRDYKITGVEIQSVPGKLTDHYNPATKTVNLSPEVYSGSSVTAAAIAAHECGHAVQHATAYAWLQMRSKMVPAVQISSNLVQWVLLGGILLINVFGPGLLLAGIVLFALTTLFAFITLPVEFDASKRALAWLDNSRIMSSVDHEKAKDGLKWAAMTYVVAAIGSLATLLYYVMVYTRRN
jgi:Zn-dependent membrane protease YugP